MAAAEASTGGGLRRVVFTFQGAFGPPTYGHYMSMKNFATKISQDYPSDKNEVTMLFMPSGNSSDKKHLLPTQSDRKAVLDVFCEMLKTDFPQLTFETSEIEYNVVNEGEVAKSNPATITTLEKIGDKYHNATILVGMGLDNMFELPFWTSIDEYANKCEKIYVVDRELSEDERGMVKTCTITNASSGANVEIKIKASIPSWWNKGDNLKITKEMAEKLGLDTKEINSNVELNAKMTTAPEFNYSGQLPEIVIIKPPSDMQIPGTSSTLLRKLIASFNAPGVDESRKDQLKQMIQTMMFGPTPSLDVEILTRVLYQTISGYNKIPTSKQAEDADFAAYDRLFPGSGAAHAGTGASGGYRKKTRKNKKKSTKRRLRKVKMNSRNLRMKKKRSRSRK